MFKLSLVFFKNFLYFFFVESNIFINLRFELSILVFDDFRILEMLFKFLLTLNSSVLNFTNLLRFIVFPFVTIIFIIEIYYENWV